MTDNEIIKALECCRQNEGDCPDHCPLRYDTECTSHLASKALTIINRKMAKIERLRAMVDAVEDHFAPLPFKNDFDEYIDKCKAEAVKEFAERVKEKIRTMSRIVVYDEDIDNLVKEFTEGEQK